MKKLISACAVCAVAVGLVVVPSAFGVKSPKIVGGSVTVGYSPSTITSTTSSVAASGNVAASSGCRKGRTVHFAYVNGTTVTPLAVVAATRPNGDYTASLPKPTDTNPPTASVVLRVTVDPATRTVGGRKKGRRTKKGRAFNCLQLTADSTPIAIAASSPAPTA
jgi:hypothetical protein